MDNFYTVISNQDGWQVEVYDDIPVCVAQWIADALGIGVDYIQECDLADLAARAYRMNAEYGR